MVLHRLMAESEVLNVEKLLVISVYKVLVVVVVYISSTRAKYIYLISRSRLSVIILQYVIELVVIIAFTFFVKLFS